MTCPDQYQILDYIEKQGSRIRRRLMTFHFAFCESCLQRLADLSRATSLAKEMAGLPPGPLGNDKAERQFSNMMRRVERQVKGMDE